MSRICPVCGRTLEREAGVQKYHSHCARELERARGGKRSKEERIILARQRVMQARRERNQKFGLCDEEDCLSFARTGPQSGHCMLPRCQRNFWN